MIIKYMFHHDRVRTQGFTMNTIMIVSASRKVLLEVGSDGQTASFPEGAAISEYGANNAAPMIVVHNSTDRKNPNGTWQGAGAGDFIIVNEVPEYIALDAINMLDGSNESIKRAIVYLIDNGCADQYTCSAKDYAALFTPAGLMKGRSGIMKRDNRDLVPIYRDKGGVLRIKLNGEMRHIEPNILLRTYRMPDGSKIVLKTIPTEKRPGLFSRLFGTNAA